jgi:hypothetical protein
VAPGYLSAKVVVTKAGEVIEVVRERDIHTHYSTTQTIIIRLFSSEDFFQGFGVVVFGG